MSNPGKQRDPKNISAPPVPEQTVIVTPDPIVREYVGIYRDPTRPATSQWVCAVVSWDGQGAPVETIAATAHTPALVATRASREMTVRAQKALR